MQFILAAGEFGSNLADSQEVSCMDSIIAYMNNKAPGFEHPKIDSYFYWGAALCHPCLTCMLCCALKRLSLLHYPCRHCCALNRVVALSSSYH